MLQQAFAGNLARETAVNYQEASLRQKLESRRLHLAAELQKVTEACEALDKSPETAALIESITRVSLY